MVQAFQFLLSISILVVLHELGHFIPAKLFKTRVEKFYLFFDPWFSLFKIKKGETEYGIGWLPLGGYVKIAGMVDESLDTEQLKNPPQPWEFRAKPAWQRLIIMLGGVVVNFILGFLIYGLMLYYYGEEYIPADGLKYGIHADSLAREIGLRDGDLIIGIDGKPVENFQQIPIQILLNDPKYLDVVRNGETLKIDIKEDLVTKLIRKQGAFIEPAIVPIVDSVIPASPALNAGLQKGDRIIAINDHRVYDFQDFAAFLKLYKNDEVVLSVIRSGDTIKLNPVTPDKNGKLGFFVQDITKQIDIKIEKYTLAEAIPQGVKKGTSTLVNYVKQFKLVPKAPDSIGGFYTIAKQFDETWNWRKFWAFTAMLSIILGIMNLLPIPALDGGHVMFLIYEVITGRKPGEKFLQYAQVIGMILILALLIYANMNDVQRIFAK